MNNEDRIINNSKRLCVENIEKFLEHRPCAKCGTSGTLASFQKCSYCGCAMYCSKECELDHKVIHAPECQITAGARDKAMFLTHIEIMVRNKNNCIYSFDHQLLRRFYSFPTLLNEHYTDQYNTIGQKQTQSGNK